MLKDEKSLEFYEIEMELLLQNQEQINLSEEIEAQIIGVKTVDLYSLNKTDMDLENLISSMATYPELVPPMKVINVDELQQQPQSVRSAASSSTSFEWPDEIESRYVMFGNRKVLKGSDDYNIMRVKSTIAVRRCRERKKRADDEQKKKVEDLTKEKQKLANRIKQLEKTINEQNVQINVLKELITLKK